jgi:hypothetical protein
LPAVSVTEVMWLVAPLYALAESTSRCPLVVGVGNEPLSDVAAAVSVAPAYCTNAGVVPDAAWTVRLNDVV